jgi:hypothetical protein
MIDGVRAIKGRWTLRGFKDRQQEYETFAGTASRWAQRLVASVTARAGTKYRQWSFDISQAFAKGMTFEELSKYTGEPLRHIQLQLSASDVEFVRKQKGFEDFDPARECIDMLKAVYGLKDAPRAWRKKLHEVLLEYGLTPLIADEELYIKFNDEGEMVILLSIHVDDLKGCSTEDEAKKLVAHITKKVGKCTEEWDNFMHTGVEHVREEDGAIYLHQNKYVDQINPLVINTLKGKPDDEKVDTGFHSLYMSLLGGVAWTALTRVDMLVYIQSLQRHAHAPRVCDCKRINVVLRYLKKVRGGLRYKPLPPGVDLKLLGISDAAFKAIPEESAGLALRGYTTLLTPVCGDKPAEGLVHMVDFGC